MASSLINLDAVNSSLEPGEWEQPIFNCKDVECGLFRAKVLGNETILKSYFQFNEDGEFEFYRNQIPFEKICPIALLINIQIEESEQKKGYGSSGILKFLEQAREQGANCGFLRIGWADEEELKRNLNFYSKNGWVLLKNYERCTVPFLYHKL